MAPVYFGWEVDHQGLLIPRTVPNNVTSAPSEVLQLIHCKCKSSGCQTVACSVSKLGCTIFCLCEAGESCKNPLIKNNIRENDSFQTDDEGEESDGNNEDTDIQNI